MGVGQIPLRTPIKRKLPWASGTSQSTGRLSSPRIIPELFHISHIAAICYWLLKRQGMRQGRDFVCRSRESSSERRCIWCVALRSKSRFVCLCSLLVEPNSTELEQWTVNREVLEKMSQKSVKCKGEISGSGGLKGQREPVRGSLPTPESCP